MDMSDALQTVRDRVELAKPELPEDPRDDLVVQEISSADALPDHADQPVRRLSTLRAEEDGGGPAGGPRADPGVLGVDLIGGIENEVQVDVDPEQLAYYDLGLLDVQDAIGLQNLTIPGGKLALGTYDYQVRVPGEVDDVEEILDFVLNPGMHAAGLRPRRGHRLLRHQGPRDHLPGQRPRRRHPGRSRSAAARTSSASPTRSARPSSGCGRPSRPGTEVSIVGDQSE